MKVCYSHRELQRVQTLACQGWPILCRSSWHRCPQASDPNIFPHLGRMSGSASGYGCFQTPASGLCGTERNQQGERQKKTEKRQREGEVIKIKRTKEQGDRQKRRNSYQTRIRTKAYVLVGKSKIQRYKMRKKPGLEADYSFIPIVHYYLA